MTSSPPPLTTSHIYLEPLPSDDPQQLISHRGISFRKFRPGTTRRRAYTSPDPSLFPKSSFDHELPLTPKNQKHHDYLGDHRIQGPTSKLGSSDLEPLILRDPLKPTLLDKLLNEGGVDLDAYGITEYRDGFFDALFFKPAEVDRQELLIHAQNTLPDKFKESNPLSLRKVIPRHLQKIKRVVWRVLKTRSGVKLAKSFLAFLIAYILCIVPTTRMWLGQYSFYMVISTIICHPSRTVGAQIEGAILTSIGTALGLGWGALGLFISTSTSAAQQGYGGVLAVFVAVFMGIISALRATYIRMYQLVLCAGIAATYACLSDVTGKRVEWSKFYDHGIPWFLGQAIALIVNLLFFPDAGARPIASTMHNTFATIMEGLEITRKNKSKLRRKLADSFVDLNTAYRDLAIEITVSRFYDADIKELVDLLQGVVHFLVSFEDNEELIEAIAQYSSVEPVFANNSSSPGKHNQSQTAVECIAAPIQQLFVSMKECVMRCDAIIMDLSGYRMYLGPPHSVPNELDEPVALLRAAMESFDTAEVKLLDRIRPEKNRTDLPGIVKLFIFCRPIRDAAATIEALSTKINDMKGLGRHLPLIHWPSYPFWEGLNRTNAQVRHDRGGVTAGSYYISFGAIAGVIKDMKTRAHAPQALEADHFRSVADPDLDDPLSLDKTRLRYKLWKVLHRLQGFEARYAFKMVFVTGLLSIPAWIKASHREWWNTYNCWWMVAMAWIMMHPRVGGNFQDLFTRCGFAIAGAFWGSLSYTAGKGNPVVMVIFATVYMIPMLYRFALSNHPRSGLVGCFSFTIVSLTAKNSSGDPPPFLVGVNTGLSIAAGIAAAIFVNWLLWPFVARHELRNAMAKMMFYMSVMYRTVVAKYVYYEGSIALTQDEMEKNELIERVLREGFVRIRQLLSLTRHEIRLRENFDARPYAALINSCERFFQYLVSVRHASVTYDRSGGIEDEDVVGELLSYRRDAVAAILSNLYILSGALRSNKRVPRYLPSAPAVRKRLLEKLDEVRSGSRNAKTGDTSPATQDAAKRQRKAQAYDYLYHQSLTGCVTQLQELERYTKEIVGEQGFDDLFRDPYELKYAGVI